MNHHPAQGKILLMNVGAHAIFYLAFSVQLCDLDATNPCWYRRPVSKGSRPHMFYDVPVQRSHMPTSGTPCSWVGLLILLADPILPDPSGEQQLRAVPASIRFRWRQDALPAQPQILQRTKGWDGCGSFLSEGLR